MFFSMNDLVFEVIFFVGISERSVFLGLCVFFPLLSSHFQFIV